MTLDPMTLGLLFLGGVVLLLAAAQVWRGLR